MTNFQGMKPVTFYIFYMIALKTTLIIRYFVLNICDGSEVENNNFLSFAVASFYKAKILNLKP